jgi:ATP-dependent RNA helicase DeaD
MKTPTVDALAGFAALGLDPKIVAALTALGYEEPTPIQRAAIPPLLEGRDLLGQAATGTGKTAAFSLPLLQRIAALDKTQRGTVSALVLTPTRELAAQVAEAIQKYSRGLGVTVLAVYGGADILQQRRALSRGVDVVVATPGRAVDLIERKSLALQHVRMVVLDEADEMLDMGFAEDLAVILGETPADRQTALFSATMSARVSTIAKQHLQSPIPITIAREVVPEGEIPRVRQIAYIVPRAHKIATLGRVLDLERPSSALIFCRTRTEVDDLTETVRKRGYRAEALHGGMSQAQRDRVMKSFRANTIQLLIATDVAARGLNVQHLGCVVNYDVPSSAEAYVHRIGRTGRAGRDGIAITLADPRERRYLSVLERSTKQKFEFAAVPTNADIRTRRLERTRDVIREILANGDLNAFRTIVDSLANESSMRDVAAAAFKAAHEAQGPVDETTPDIPAFEVPSADSAKKGGKFVKHGRAQEREKSRTFEPQDGRPKKSLARKLDRLQLEQRKPTKHKRDRSESEPRARQKSDWYGKVAKNKGARPKSKGRSSSPRR